MNTTLPVPAEEEYPPKITAGMVEGDCPKPLRDLGKQIAAHLDKADKYDEKAKQHLATVGQLLAQVKDLCDEGGFNAVREKFFPGLGRSRTYEILQIATGKKSIEDIRASNRERQARCRAAKDPESVTVTDSAPPETTSNDTDNTASAAQRCAYYAEADAEPDPDQHATGDDDQHDIDQDRGGGDQHHDVERADPARSDPAQITPISPKSKIKKPSLVNSWEALPEDRETIRELVLEEYFKRTSGSELRDRMRAARPDLIRHLLDALGVDDVLQAMSTEFGKLLRDRVPAPKRKSGKSDNKKFKTMTMEPIGSDASGDPSFADQPRKRSQVH